MPRQCYAFSTPWVLGDHQPCRIWKFRLWRWCWSSGFLRALTHGSCFCYWYCACWRNVGFVYHPTGNLACLRRCSRCLCFDERPLRIFELLLQLSPRVLVCRFREFAREPRKEVVRELADEDGHNEERREWSTKGHHGSVFLCPAMMCPCVIHNEGEATRVRNSTIA